MRSVTRSWWSSLAAVAIVLLVAATAASAEYPQRPIRVAMPWAAGSALNAHQRNHGIAAPMSSAEFTHFMRSEDDKWRRIVENSGAMP